MTTRTPCGSGSGTKRRCIATTNTTSSRLSRWEDVEPALIDWETYRSGKGTIFEIIKAVTETGLEMPPGILLFEDPPIHDLHRGLLSRVFTPRRMAAIEPLIQQFCAMALDPLVGAGEFDVIADFGRFVPMRTIGYLLGIPEEAQEAIRNNTDARLALVDGKPPEVGDATFEVTNDLIADYIDWRVDHPSDDLMTELLNAEVDDDDGRRRLTRTEVLTYTNMIAGAGNETATRLIGFTTELLATHPEQRQAIVDDRDLLAPAIEEVLRYEAPSPVQARYVAKEVEVHGITIPEGSIMLLLNGSANRDERHFPDADHFDIRRADGPASQLRLRPALLPGRRTGQTRGPGRARRDPAALADLGGRPRAWQESPHRQRARVGNPSGHPDLTTCTCEPRTCEEAMAETRRYANLINGVLKPAGSGAYFDSYNPATGELLAQIPASDRADAVEAVEAAAAAFPGWSTMAPKARAGYLENGRRDLRRVRVRARPARVGGQRHLDRCGRGDERHGHGRLLEERGPRNGDGIDRSERGPRLEHVRDHAARALRGHRRDHSVQHADRDVRCEGRAGPRRRQHRGREASRASERRSPATHRVARGGVSPGCAQRRRGDGRGRRRARPPRGGPEGDDDGIIGDREDDPEGGGGHAHAQHLRARWEVAEHRLCRCRSGPRRVRRDDPVDLHVQCRARPVSPVRAS